MDRTTSGKLAISAAVAGAVVLSAVSAIAGSSSGSYGPAFGTYGSSTGGFGRGGFGTQFGQPSGTSRFGSSQGTVFGTNPRPPLGTSGGGVVGGGGTGGQIVIDQFGNRIFIPNSTVPTGNTGFSSQFFGQ